MARNTNPWYKTYPELWLGSERVKLMSLASEGLYRRCIDYQAQHGSIPNDTAILARLLCKDQADVEAAWPAVLEHFDGSETNASGEDRLFNTKLRAVIYDATEALEARRKAAEKTNVKRKEKKLVSTTNSDRDGQRSGDRAIRASSSSSLSKSSSLSFFKEFWDCYPNKQKKVRAEAMWLKKVQSEDLARAIISNVAERAQNDQQWLRDDGQFIPHPATYLNNEQWHDMYRRAVLPQVVSSGPEPEPEPAPITLPPLQALDPRAWANAVHAISLEHPEAMDDFIRPLRPLGIDGDTLWVVAPSGFVCSWVTSNYASILSSLLSLSLRMVTGAQIGEDTEYQENNA